MLAAVTCFAPIGFSLADPAAESAATAAVTIPFPTPLTDEIKKLDEEAAKDPSPHKLHAKKASILKAAFDNLPPAPWKSETAVVGLAHPENYQFDTSKKPSDPKYFPKYFPDNFKNNNVTVTAEPQGLYDYRTDEMWVDFANLSWAGASSVMAWSKKKPWLVNASARGCGRDGYSTRDHGKPGVLGSNPTPLVLRRSTARSSSIKSCMGADGRPKRWTSVKKSQTPKT